MIAVASADVSHLRQYLPPFEQQAAPAVQALPTNEQLRQYLPPAPPAAALPQPAPAPQEPRFAEPAAASFNEVT